MAAAYVAAEFQRLGLMPLRGAFLQRFPIARIEPGHDSAQSLEIRSPASASLRIGADFVPVNLGEGLYGRGEIRIVPDLERMASSQGAVVIVRTPTSAIATAAARAPEVARIAGAAAVLLVLDVPEGVFPNLRRFTLFGPRYELGVPRAGEVPTAFVRLGALPDGLQSLIMEGYAGAVEMEGGLRTHATVTAQTTANVVAVSPGRDPTLAHELVVISAHLDGLGVGRAVGEDSIYNGADDNASGVAAMMELAAAFATQSQHRRSVAFVAFGAEEIGMLGSRFFIREPTLPVDQIVAILNIDMIGRNEPDSLYVIGRRYSSLGSVVERAISKHPELGMSLQEPPDDPTQPTPLAERELRIWARSDQQVFAEAGVPGLFFHTGTHPDYHTPADEASALDFVKMERITRLIKIVADEVASADTRPQWNAAWQSRLAGQKPR